MGGVVDDGNRRRVDWLDTLEAVGVVVVHVSLTMLGVSLPLSSEHYRFNEIKYLLSGCVGLLVWGILVVQKWP